MSSAASKQEFLAVFDSSVGWIGIRGSRTGLRSLTFGHATRDAARRAMGGASPIESDDVPNWMRDAQQLLIEYAEGEPVDLTQIPLDLPPGTPFERRVRDQLSRVGYGETISYGELAAAAGKPGAARAVGNMMARNPAPLVLPCHRVLAAGGRLGGYSAPSGLGMKKRLLELERQSMLAGVRQN